MGSYCIVVGLAFHIEVTKKRMYFQGWIDNTANSVLVLHLADLSSVPGMPYSPLSTVRRDP